MHLSRFVSANLCSTSICKVRTVLSRIVKCDKMFIVRIKKKNYIWNRFYQLNVQSKKINLNAVFFSVLVMISAVIGSFCILVIITVIFVLRICKNQRKGKGGSRYGIDNPTMTPVTLGLIDTLLCRAQH